MVIDYEKIIVNFIVMILEGLPFLLIGAIASAIIQLFISEDRIKKIIPKNNFLAMLIASLLGIFMPICECAIIPVTRSLIQKKVPLKIAVIFMLSVPIVNPIVTLSTYYAFSDIRILLIRLIGGMISAIAIGVLIDKTSKGNVLKKSNLYGDYCECGCSINNFFTNKSKIRLCIEHSISEFFKIFRYYIFGAFISSIFMGIINENMLKSLGSNKLLSILIMMIIAFILSLCSEADAFIAKGFLEYFNIPSISAFLILGPMMDLKNAIIVGSYFKKEFTVKLIGIIFMVVGIFSLLLNLVF